MTVNHIRATSTDEFHYHLVEVDDKGNGFTTSYKYNGRDEELPDHIHKIRKNVCVKVLKHSHDVEYKL